MLENNSFRLYMVILSIVSVGLVAGFLFIYPTISFKSDSERIMYNQVMPDDRALEPGTKAMTGYQALSFYIKGTTRGNTKHY